MSVCRLYDFTNFECINCKDHDRDCSIRMAKRIKEDMKERIDEDPVTFTFCCPDFTDF